MRQNNNNNNNNKSIKHYLSIFRKLRLKTGNKKKNEKQGIKVTLIQPSRQELFAV